MTDEPEYMTTREVAALLRVKERKVYELAASGEAPCRRVTGKLLFPRAALEAWLAGGVATPAAAAPSVVAGSHDPLLDWAIRASGARLATLFDGSLDGLGRLRTGAAAAAGTHVYEPESGDWNVGHVAQALGARPVVMVAWAIRRQGLILAPALADVVRTPADLAGRRVVRRQPSAGAGLLFDHLVARDGVSGVRFIAEVARTEAEAAALVASGQAEAAPGLEAMARQFGLGFAPTMDERFDLVVDRRAWFEPPMQALLSFCRTASFAAKARELGGYDIACLGDVRWNGA